MAHSSLRFGIGRFTTEAEIDYVVQHIIDTVHKLREMRYASIALYKHLSNRGVAAHCGRWSKKGSTSIRLTGRSQSISALVSPDLICLHPYIHASASESY